MDSLLLFAAVSQSGCFLTAPPKITESLAIARSGCVSDAHHCPCLHAEEPRRSLLDLLVQDAVCQPATAGLWLAKARSRDVAARVHDSTRVRDRLGYASAVCDVCEHVGRRKERLKVGRLSLSSERFSNYVAGLYLVQLDATGSYWYGPWAVGGLDHRR